MARFLERRQKNLIFLSSLETCPAIIWLVQCTCRVISEALQYTAVFLRLSTQRKISFIAAGLLGAGESSSILYIEDESPGLNEGLCDCAQRRVRCETDGAMPGDNP
jgi:hypothetical protein